MLIGLRTLSVVVGIEGFLPAETWAERNETKLLRMYVKMNLLQQRMDTHAHTHVHPEVQLQWRAAQRHVASMPCG